MVITAKNREHTTLKIKDYIEHKLSSFLIKNAVYEITITRAVHGRHVSPANIG